MDQLEWDSAPVAMPWAIRAVRRRREIVVFKPRDWKFSGEKRGAISEFSTGSASRLRRTVSNSWCDWRAMWTLTYREAPTSGPEVKAHLRAFWERLRRRGYLKNHAIIWFLEFQQRGAAHVHCFTTGYVDKDWIAENWADITGGNPRACTRVEGMRNPDSAGAYAAKYSAKKEQKIAPDWFKDVGRWWGYIGKRPKEEDLPAWACTRSRGRARTGERVGRPRLIPRRGATTSREAATVAMTVVRAAQKPQERWHVGYYCTEHAIIFYGDESEIDQLWGILCPITGRS